MGEQDVNIKVNYDTQTAERNLEKLEKKTISSSSRTAKGISRSFSRVNLGVAGVLAALAGPSVIEAVVLAADVSRTVARNITPGGAAIGIGLSAQSGIKASQQQSAKDFGFAWAIAVRNSDLETQSLILEAAKKRQKPAELRAIGESELNQVFSQQRLDAFLDKQKDNFIFVIDLATEVLNGFLGK